MLCGLSIPVPSVLKRKPKKSAVRPAQISRPLPQGSPSMPYNGRGYADADDDNESGVYYLVTKSNGEKQLVKRPKAPLTSPPMDDDFDAYTQTGYDTISRYAPDPRDLDLTHTRSRSQGQPPAAASTSYPKPFSPVPPRDPFDPNATYDMSSGSVAPIPQRNPPMMSPPPAERHVLPQHSVYPYDSASQTMSNKGKARQDVKTYGEYQEHMQEIDKKFSPVGAGNRDSVVLGRVLSARSNRTGTRGNPSLARNASTGTHQKRKVQPAFEEVSRRVVENTPEKTVTISTWREQVAKEADVERTSVYYEGFLQTYPRSEMDDMARGSRSSASGSGRHGMIDEVPRYEHRTRSEGQNSFSRDYAQPPVEDIRRSPNPDHSLQNYKPFAKSPQAQTLVVKPASPDKSSTLSSSTSSHGSSQQPPTPPPKPPRLSLKTVDITMQQSTPLLVGQHVAMPSFAPTKDGSIISTIRSTSSATSQTFEGILSSCKSPLTHLSPVLGKLGITTVEHLKAFGGLSPEIRDRELKEDALRLGFTVMEWAILVDRLRTI